MQVTIVKWSPQLMVGEGQAMKKSNVYEWYKWLKGSSQVEITNEDDAHHFLRYQVYCSL